MGLALGLNVLADLIVHDAEGADWMRGQLKTLNEVLVKNDLAPHEEPEKLLPLARTSVQSFPYSFLHYYVRRAYACVAMGEPLITGDLIEKHKDFILDTAVTLMDSHLLSHSDCEGFYVPQDFDDPVCDDKLPGGFVGSSQRLLKELCKVAPILGIRLEGTELPKEEALRLRNLKDGEVPTWRELLVWYSLYEAARLSIEHRTLLVFH